MSPSTKKDIENALMEIAKEKPISKISINELTSKCGVNRMTFYYHFRDIYDLVKWIFEEEAKKRINTNSSYIDWKEDFLSLFNSILEHKNFYNNIFHSINADLIARYLFKIIYEVIYKLVENLCSDKNKTEENKIFAAKLISFGFVGIILDWLDNGMTENPEKIINKMEIFFKSNIFQSIVKKKE
ncbi:MAG: TetR/AcrR family transcriptional regulator [Treponemataceae bacterium]